MDGTYPNHPKTTTMQVKIINNREVKIWTDYVEESAMRQIENLTTLPFLFHHLAIMPDVHSGMGMQSVVCWPAMASSFPMPLVLISDAVCVR